MGRARLASLLPRNKLVKRLHGKATAGKALRKIWMAMAVKRQLGREVECPLCHQRIDHVEIRPSSDINWPFDYDCPECQPWIFRDPSDSLLHHVACVRWAGCSADFVAANT